MKKYYKKDLCVLFVHYFLLDIEHYLRDDVVFQEKLRDLNNYLISKLDVEYEGEIVDEYVVMEVEEKE